MTFRELVESNINHKNFDNLKAFMKKQPGFKSWTFEGDYETLVIGFKKNIQAINAFKKSNASYLEVNAFGDTSAGNSEIRVELNKDAIRALSSDENLKEANQAKKVHDYFLQTMKKIKDYSEDKSNLDKLNRRILTDYAGDPAKLKEIYKQITKISTEIEQLKSIIG